MSRVFLNQNTFLFIFVSQLVFSFCVNQCFYWLLFCKTNLFILFSLWGFFLHSHMKIGRQQHLEWKMKEDEQCADRNSSIHRPVCYLSNSNKKVLLHHRPFFCYFGDAFLPLRIKGHERQSVIQHHVCSYFLTPPNSSLLTCRNFVPKCQCCARL